MQKRVAPHLSRIPRPGDHTQPQVRGTLDDVRRIIGVEPAPLAKALPEAIVQATEERATAMEAALEPTVSRSIRVVASRDSRWLGEILAPAIGVAVRKAVAQAFAAMMQRFNEALDKSLSLRSLKWRLEARRTGRPFAEVVLLRTLVYRVEQVFLIHTQTGLVLQHVGAEGLPSANPDQVASMLAAIDAFGREAFASAPGAYLHEFSMGDLTVWVDRGPAIAVAIVIRGKAPRTLLERVTETRERIELEYRESLARFRADTSPFSATVPLLESCLTEQTKQPPQRGPVILAAAALVIVVVVGTLVVRSRTTNAAEEAQLQTYRHVLATQPGIIVTSASSEDGRYRLSGLRDPLTPEPAKLVAGLGPRAPELAFQPFYSLDPRIIETRFRRALQPPETVTVAFRGGTLHLAGEASREWTDRALALASTLPGIERVQSTLSDATARELASAARELQRIEVSFASGSAELDRRSRAGLARALELSVAIERLSAGLRQPRCISVIGDADETGTAAENRRLARERAQVVAAALREKGGAHAPRLEVRGRGKTDRFPRGRLTRFQVSEAEGCAEGARG
jgi:outer membrane protein OmpA-like peptidoglycan-associated protein